MLSHGRSERTSEFSSLRPWFGVVGALLYLKRLYISISPLVLLS